MHEANAIQSDVASSRAWWLLPFLCTVALGWLVHAELLVTPTVPASYDLTGHILPIAELADRLLPQGRIHGWSGKWFTGFPLFYFYFPLPALLVAVMASVLALSAALKLTAMLGVLLFPVALFTLFRSISMTRAQAAVASTVATTFVLMQSFYFLGGNIASTLAGEFAISISLTLSLFYLASVLRAGSSRRAPIVPGILLAAVALSHLVPALTMVVITAALLIDPTRRRNIVLSWIVAFVLAAFWTLPFVVRHGEMTAVYAHVEHSLREVLPLELWPVMLVAAAGVFAVARNDRARPLLYLTLAGLLGYLLAGRLVYPGRFLPYWYLGVHLLAGYAAASLLPGQPARRLELPRSTTVGAVLIVLPLLVLNGIRGTGNLRSWAHTTFAGLETRASWPELQQLMQQLERGSGRVYWEQAPHQMAALGSRNLAAATPYLASGQPVLNGLWIESSRLHHELVAIDSSVARAGRASPGEADHQMQDVLRRLRELGVTRFVALTGETARVLARTPGVTLAHAATHVALFTIPAAALIEVVNGTGVPVQLLDFGDERVRFRTSAVGTPHLVRMAYFPNWRSYGASQPVRAQHGLITVTPRQSEVDIRFTRTWVEIVGAAVSLLGVLALSLTFGWRLLAPGGKA